MKLGIIGGMGPSATAVLYDRITDMTDAKRDQDHMEILLFSCPQIADRTAYILDPAKENPGPQMTEAGLRLREAGAEILAMPCVTAHYFAEEIERGTGLPLIHMPRETARYLKERGILRAGIMATDGTIKSGIFKEALLAEGITPVIPGGEDQRGVMEIIYGQVKAGRPADMELFRRISGHLLADGCGAVILGCTEFAVVKARGDVGHGCLSALDVLAQSCVQRCGYPLREGSRELIS